MSFLQWVDNIDKHLFRFVHLSLANSFFDAVMPIVRYPQTWIPLYAFLLFWIIRYHKQYAIKFVLLSVITFGITDSVSGSFLKPLVGRLRPCHSPDLQSVIRHIVDCGGMYGFPSSHASNHFGLAAFWFASVFSLTGKKWRWLWFWAALVCFAQVYVGVHYPFDILCGALLGLATGTITSLVFKWWANPKKNTGMDERVPNDGIYTN